MNACDEWFAQRAGRITVTLILHFLIKQVCYQHWFHFSSKATKWGCDHENIAFGLHAEVGKQHSSFRCFRDYAFTKNIKFSQPHQMVLLSATVVVMGFLR